ncbi:hypothetical protein EON65_49110 [archaeon]|nr:MAG: hypothetical protein EON65_49110 [archaeon]
MFLLLHPHRKFYPLIALTLYTYYSPRTAYRSKLKKSKSKVQSEDQGTGSGDKDEVLEDSPPNLRRAKSKSGGTEVASRPKSGSAKQKSKKNM